ncbi:MAG: carbon storage regulator [Acidobacteria bacterium]|nr:carbon storage regulator [Acidobacteriota bacterium]
MLILTRRKGQQIRVGESVVLTVLELNNGRVRLGFEAPEDVVILRQEIQSDFRLETPAAKRSTLRPRIKG